MKKIASLIAASLLLAGVASAAPLSDQGTSTSDSNGTQAGQTGKPSANEKAMPKAGTTGSGVNSNMGTPAKDSMQKDKSPASQGAGSKQEK
jgi:hypothetical protein